MYEHNIKTIYRFYLTSRTKGAPNAGLEKGESWEKLQCNKN